MSLMIRHLGPPQLGCSWTPTLRHCKRLARWIRLRFRRRLKGHGRALGSAKDTKEEVAGFALA
jgi:hypothetical protein